MVNAGLLMVGRVTTVREKLRLYVCPAGPAVVEQLMRLRPEVFELAARADPANDLIVELLFRDVV